MTTLKRALDDLLNPQLPLGQAADRHISPDFRQRTNGKWGDRAEFVTRIAELRRNTQQITITVLDELADDSRYAERHIVDLVTRDGQRLTQEVYLFAAFDHNGRFDRIEEVTRTVALDERPPV